MVELDDNERLVVIDEGDEIDYMDEKGEGDEMVFMTAANLDVDEGDEMVLLEGEIDDVDEMQIVDVDEVMDEMPYTDNMLYIYELESLKTI